jgi:hypothetical protein
MLSRNLRQHQRSSHKASRSAVNVPQLPSAKRSSQSASRNGSIVMSAEAKNPENVPQLTSSNRSSQSARRSGSQSASTMMSAEAKTIPGKIACAVRGDAQMTVPMGGLLPDFGLIKDELELGEILRSNRKSNGNGRRLLARQRTSPRRFRRFCFLHPLF